MYHWFTVLQCMNKDIIIIIIVIISTVYYVYIG